METSEAGNASLRAFNALAIWFRFTPIRRNSSRVTKSGAVDFVTLTRCPSARRRSLKAIALPLAFLSLSSYGIGYYVVRIIYLELATIDLLEASLHDGSRSLITQTHNMRHGRDARRKTRGNDDRRASRRPRRSDKKGHGGAETAAPPPLGRKNPTR